MPAFITSTRVAATSFPALIKSSVWKSTSTARSNASPCSIRLFITAATSVTTIGLYPVECSNCGPISAMTILVTREPNILSSAPWATPPRTMTTATAAQKTRRTLRLLTRQCKLERKQDRQHHDGRFGLGEPPGHDLGRGVRDESKADAGRDRVGQRHRHRRDDGRTIVGDVVPRHLGEALCHHTGDIEQRGSGRIGRHHPGERRKEQRQQEEQRDEHGGKPGSAACGDARGAFDV